MANEIISSNRGLGEWVFEIYNPNKVLPAIKGYLYITKDHHTIFKDPKLTETILSVPSQNVSYVYKILN